MKQYRALCFVVLALLAVGASARQSHKACCDNGKPEKAKAKIKGYHGPQSLGPLSLDTPDGAVPMQAVLSMIGLRASQRAAIESEDEICFVDDASGLSVLLTRGADDSSLLRAIELSQWGTCPASAPLHAGGFANWSTREGIHIGSPEADVIKAYGKPSETSTASNDPRFSLLPYGMKATNKPTPAGARVLSYLAEEDKHTLDCAFFGIANHRVVWIDVSDNE